MDRQIAAACVNRPAASCTPPAPKRKTPAPSTTVRLQLPYVVQLGVDARLLSTPRRGGVNPCALPAAWSPSCLVERTRRYQVFSEERNAGFEFFISEAFERVLGLKPLWKQ